MLNNSSLSKNGALLGTKVIGKLSFDDCLLFNFCRRCTCGVSGSQAFAKIFSWPGVVVGWYI